MTPVWCLLQLYLVFLIVHSSSSCLEITGNLHRCVFSPWAEWHDGAGLCRWQQSCSKLGPTLYSQLICQRGCNISKITMQELARKNPRSCVWTWQRNLWKCLWSCCLWDNLRHAFNVLFWASTDQWIQQLGKWAGNWSLPGPMHVSSCLMAPLNSE